MFSMKIGHNMMDMKLKIKVQAKKTKKKGGKEKKGGGMLLLFTM